jgi:calcineurin-like phosphoesterase family protein
MEYFTADWHLNHTKIIKYCNRPFKNALEMDNTIVTNAIQRLKRGDLLYYLGDLTFNRSVALSFFDIMDDHGVQVHFIFGSHDYKDHRVKKIIEERAVWTGDFKSIKVKNQPISLMHYAMRVWPKSHFNAWHLYGHSHGGLSNDKGVTVGKTWDVGVDNNQFQILSFDEIVDIMEIRPDNFNLIDRSDREK